MTTRYPIYVPSKGRHESGHTPKFLIKDGTPFYLVVEPQEAKAYGDLYGHERLLILPWSGNDATRAKFCADRSIENGGLIAVRNWIKEHSIAGGHVRHWQLDDNITKIYRRASVKIPCNSGASFAAVEDFVDRYENVAVAGLNYEMFAPRGNAMPPFCLNVHVYSCSLILNSMAQKWRLAYNDDTDLCLQVLAAGFCTVAFNAFLAKKIATMKIKGGNTTDLYQGDGRCKMARSLERMWPGVVQTKRRFNRPQHVVNWKKFDTPLKLKPGIDLSKMQPNEYGLKLVQVKPVVKSAAIRAMLEAANV